MTHAGQMLSPAQYNAYRDMVIGFIEDSGESVDSMIERQMATDRGVKSREDALDELRIHHAPARAGAVVIAGRPFDPLAAAEAVAADQASGMDSLGVVFGGSGNGEQMAANKVNGIRAALVWNDDTAMKAREHNNANIVSIGARQHSEAEALRLIDFF